MALQIAFAPAGLSAALTLDVVPAAASMPAVDGSNVDLTVTNSGAAAARLAFGLNAAVGTQATGTLVVPPGSTVLLTSNAAILQAANGRPAVLTIQGGAWATAALVNAMVDQRGGVVTLQRGTATVQIVF